MAKQTREEIVKNLILTGNLKEFRDIFLYVHRTDIASQMGINYTRFLNLVRNPKPLRFSEVYTLAHILNVPARNITDLIHQQIESEIGKKNKRR